MDDSVQHAQWYLTKAEQKLLPNTKNLLFFLSTVNPNKKIQHDKI